MAYFRFRSTLDTGLLPVSSTDHPCSRSTAQLSGNLLILLSYPLNFFIYCGMSRQFRGTLCALLRCRAPEAASTSAAGMTTVAPPRGDATHYIEMTPAVADRPGSRKYTADADHGEPVEAPAAEKN